MTSSGQSNSSPDDRLQEVLAKYRTLQATGAPPDPDRFLAEHPDVADSLRPHLLMESDPDVTLPPSTTRDSLAESPPTHSPEQDTDATGSEVESAAGETGETGAPPALFGRYRIVKTLGEGAMGVVYLADDTQLHRQVALKIPKYNSDDGPEWVERFYREARTAATLRSANICPVYDVGEVDGTHYLTMAYINGGSLSDLVDEASPPPVRDVVRIVRKLALALEEAHAKGIVHRDLKPTNVLLDEKREPIIMDFGLARQIKKQDARLTQCGAILGSPAYMSPEQVEGDADTLGPAGDIYSLGVILYELLTGVTPFQGSTAAVLGQILTREPRKPTERRPEIDPQLEAICLRMMAKRVDDRFATSSEVAEALAQHLVRPGAETAVHQHGEPRINGTAVSGPALAATGDVTSTAVHRDSGLEAPPAGTAFVPRWMLWTGLGVLVTGFGLTWTVMAYYMKHDQQALAVEIDSDFKQAVEDETMSVFLDEEEINLASLSAPIFLNPGTHPLVIRRGGQEIISQEIVVVEGEKPLLNISYRDGKIDVKVLKANLHDREIAEWALGIGGRINLGDGTVSEASVLPETSFHVIEIDLSNINNLKDADLERFAKLRGLEHLNLENTPVSDAAVKILSDALPNCTISR
jgi:predicted Ser/Thr protein kinase